MSKGVSDKFDEHEHDTARRAYPQEVVDGSRRTTRMAPLDLDALRTESGTRPALTHDAIERHVREKIDDALTDAEHASGQVDAHSRPTIEAGVFGAMPAAQATDWSAALSAAMPPGAAVSTTHLAAALGPLPASESLPGSGPSSSGPSSWNGVALGPVSRPTPLAAAPSDAPARRAPIAGWVVAVALLGIVLMVSAAGAAGFALGRRTSVR